MSDNVKPGMNIGIIVAMESEFESIKAILDPKYRVITYGNRNFLSGKYNNHRLVVCVGGIGKVNAATTATLMLDHFNIDLVISTGCAGAVESHLKVGDIVIGTDVCYHDVWCPMTPETEKGELPGTPSKISLKKALDLLPYRIEDFADAPVYVGHIYTGDQFIQTKEKCEEIRGIYPEDKTAGICEMESMAIAQVCHQFGDVLFTSFRVVSDTPCRHDDSSTQMKQYEDFWKTMSDTSYKFLKYFLDNIEGGK